MNLGNIECRQEGFNQNFAGWKLSAVGYISNELERKIRQKTGRAKRGSNQISEGNGPTRPLLKIATG